MKNKFIIIGVPFFILLVLFSSIVYRGYTHTPKYAIKQIRQSIAKHDKVTFFKYFDVDELFDNYWKYSEAKIMAEMAKNEPQDAWAKMGYEMGMSLFKPFLENLKETTKELITISLSDAVEKDTGDWSEVFKNAIIKFTKKIKKEGILEISIKNEPETKVLFDMKQTEKGYWKICGMNSEWLDKEVGDFSEYTTTSSLNEQNNSGLPLPPLSSKDDSSFSNVTTKQKKEAAEYMQRFLEVYEIKSGYREDVIDGKVPAVFGKIRNNGNKTLKKVEVTAYFFDRSGKVIFEDSYPAVLSGGFMSDDTPLKPNYIKEFGFKSKGCPSEWFEGNVRLAITDIEFEY